MGEKYICSNCTITINVEPCKLEIDPFLLAPTECIHPNCPFDAEWKLIK